MSGLIELQDFLFSKEVKRSNLLNYIKDIQLKTYKVFVYRNHSFELIQNTINAYLNYANINIEFEYSDYDDSLSFVNLNTNVDALLLWIDLSRYSDNQAVFLQERIKYLKTLFKKNIILACVGGKIETNDSSIINVDFSPIQKELRDTFNDFRMSQFSGTNLSNRACLKISKELGLKYLPQALLPCLKAIIVDLDNTLYKGVLGEDGSYGVVLTDGHKILQNSLKTFLKKGVLLCFVSKNDIRDTKDLFTQRVDFPLKWNYFTETSASWDNKSVSISKIIKELNINEDSVLFIDDNLGEISEVKQTFPQIKYILANEDANITNTILNNYPCLEKNNITKEDTIRSKDLQANVERQKAQNSMNKYEYLNSLNVELTFEINQMKHVDRISELSNKTNQFIFTHKRYSKALVLDLINNTNYCVINIALKDKLSDSGIIGVLVLHKTDCEKCNIEELFISCRALGRGLDEIIIFKALEIGLKKLRCKQLKVDFVSGERNKPAANFAEKYFNEYLNLYSNYANYNISDKIDMKEIIVDGSEK